MSVSRGYDDYDDRDSQEEAPKLPGFFFEPIGVLRRRWAMMLSMLVVGLVVVAAVSSMMKPDFTSRAKVLLSSQRISEEFFRSTVENDQIEKAGAIISEIMSRKSLAAIVEEHQLYTDAQRPIAMEERVALLRDELAIGELPSSGPQRRESTAAVYGISYRSKSPETAATVTNTVAQRFTDIHLQMRSRQARLTTNFLQSELRQVEADLTRQEREITEYKQKYRGELPGELQTNLSRLDRLQSQRQSLSIQIAEAETQIASMAHDVRLDPNSRKARLERLRAEYEARAAVFTLMHPNVMSVARQIEALEAEIAHGIALDAGAGSPVAMQLTVAELRRQLDQTETELKELDRRVSMIPVRQEELEALEGRAEVLRETYQEFLRKVSQAELAEAVESAQQGERAMVLESAVPPSLPDRSPLIFVGAGIVAALGFSLGIGLLFEILDRVVVSPSDAESILHIPVVGSSPRIA